jgi:hypothetical protein
MLHNMKAKRLQSAPAVRRTRTRNLVIRVNDREREMLAAVSEREQMSVSEAVRWLIRREYERGAVPGGDRVIGAIRSRSGIHQRGR